MANKRTAAVVACALLLVVLLVTFWRRSHSPSPSKDVAAIPATPDAAAVVQEKNDASSASANTTAPKAPTLGKDPRPITDAPHFSTMQEYRAEQAVRPLQPEPLVPPPAGKTPENEVQRIQGTVRKYRAAFGQNPVGSNPEITRALAGKNPSGARFLEAAAVSLNDAGELLDLFGTPYFFHPVSGSIMEIRSAGPDRKLFTADDIVR